MSALPEWASAMQPGHWYGISGEAPDLGPPPTPIGTRYLEGNVPARDPELNPPRSRHERVRRLAGRDWVAPWCGRVGLSSIAEACNAAVFTSRFGLSGAMTVFGGGHNDYVGSDVHAFDLARREWRRLGDGFATGHWMTTGRARSIPMQFTRTAHHCRHTPHDYVQYDEVGNDFLLLKGQTELGRNAKAMAFPQLFNLVASRPDLLAKVREKMDLLRFWPHPRHPNSCR